MHLTSPHNPLVKQWRQLRSPAGRRAHGLFLAEGEHLAREALSSGCVQTLILETEALGRYSDLLSGPVPVCQVSPQVIKALGDAVTPQGILAVCRLPQKPMLSDLGPRLVALNRLQDPGNVGTILRTMDAAGFTGLLIDSGCADPFSSKALRASMGAIFRVPVCACDDLLSALSGLPEHAVVAGDLNGSPYFDHPPFGEKVVFLIGNEGAGLDSRLSEAAHHRLKLPIVGGAESLNAAVAAAVMMYDQVRRELEETARGGTEHRR